MSDKAWLYVRDTVATVVSLVAFVVLAQMVTDCTMRRDVQQHQRTVEAFRAGKCP